MNCYSEKTAQVYSNRYPHEAWTIVGEPDKYISWGGRDIAVLVLSQENASAPTVNLIALFPVLVNSRLTQPQ